ncbi:hypothetical protein [Bdellovibrio sp. BCCA]|uniref:hypothetical protein n=1 Tax=Bdellovibrio sp. BCCA TaxID=3136281 RepID=UPI0030EFF141
MKKILVVICMAIYGWAVVASEGHDHEENASVGPDKGIISFDEHDGFKLSSEAIKNFDLKTVALKGSNPWEVPANAVLYSGEEVNVYRLRDGFYKRIDFDLISKNGSQIKIKSKDLQTGDELVVQGVGFLRTAEIVASGGAPEGHSH